MSSSTISSPKEKLLPCGWSSGVVARCWSNGLVHAKPTSAEVEELLRWVLRNIYETSTHPKLPSLLQELGHADLIPGFT